MTVSEQVTVPSNEPFYVGLSEIPVEGSVTAVDEGEEASEDTDADSLVYEGNPSANNGSHSYLNIGNDSGSITRWRSYIKFPFTSLANPAQSAKLRIYHNQIGGSGYPNPTLVTVHRVTASWTEGAITWSNRPSYDAVPAGSITITTEGWYEIDITALYNAWRDGTFSNYGVVLIHGDEAQSGNLRQFSSKEGANAPCLITRTDGAAMEEVARLIAPAEDQFAINYERGYINFSEDNAGDTIAVTYQGMGTPIRE